MQPLVSIGNAGQLAVDVLLASLQPRLELVGYLDCPYLLPIAGNDAFAVRSSVTTALAINVEGASRADQRAAAANSLSLSPVYHDASLKLTMVQQRAPVAPVRSSELALQLEFGLDQVLGQGRHREHCNMLAAWIQSVGFNSVVGLATLPSCVRMDAHLIAPDQMRGLLTTFAEVRSRSSSSHQAASLYCL
jgi:hypothetical protein